MYVHIDSLGPIRNADINIRPLMLFTGESGLGKSYLAFIANYTYQLLSCGSSRLLSFFEDIDYKSLLENKKSGDVIYTVKTSELFDWINRDAVNYIGYMVGNPSIEGKIDIKWPFQDKTIDFIYSESISGLDNNEKLTYRISSKNYKFNNDDRTVSPYVLISLVQAELIKVIYGLQPSQQLIFRSNYILPPSRGALMEIQSKPTFSSGMYEMFFKLKDDIVRPVEPNSEPDTILSDLLRRINEGSISQQNNALTYTTQSGVSIPLTAAASSIKEIAPLTMLLPKYKLGEMTIMLEEPEAHLHPARQQFLADLVGYIVSKGCQLQITTHSDYFIKRINTLMKLYPIVNSQPSKELDNLMDKHGFIKESFIDANDVVAYNLSRGEDGFTKVSLLETDAADGVPFDSFHNVITRYFDLLSDLDEMDNIISNEE